MVKRGRSCAAVRPEGALRACLTTALSILVQPSQGWGELQDQRDEGTGTLVLVLFLVIAPLTAGARTLGHVLLGWSWGGALLDAGLHPPLLLLALSLLAWGLGLLARRRGVAVSADLALRIALYSSTPLWLSGVLLLIPSLLMHTLAPFLGLLAMGHLFYFGLVRELQLEAVEAIPLAASLFAGFTLVVLLLTQLAPLPLVLLLG
jgi:hypothetical protein